MITQGTGKVAIHSCSRLEKKMCLDLSRGVSYLRFTTDHSRKGERSNFECRMKKACMYFSCLEGCPFCEGACVTVRTPALQVEKCTLVSRSGVLTDLEPSPDGAAAVVPTFTPAQYERGMNTRAAASNMERRQRTMTVHAPSTHPLHPSRHI